MSFKRFKYKVVAVFGLFLLFGISRLSQANSTSVKDQVSTLKEVPEKKGFDVNEVIMGHIKDSHDWHLFTINGHPVVIPLPVILFVPNQGFSIFSSSDFQPSRIYHGFRLMDLGFIRQYHLDPKKYFPGKIIAVNPDGSPDLDRAIYDISLTKNVVQMMLAACLLVFIFQGMAKNYRSKPNQAPTGFQNAIEPLVLFVRDDIARPMLGSKSSKYLPYLLTVFFFIWINALLSLIPGTANVAGNIAFTFTLAIFTFILILISTNKYYWQHIFWPPGVPLGVKFILIPVEILGIFTKPFALMIRLFANMLAGHMVMISIICLIFIFGSMNAAAGWGFTPISIGFTVFMFLMELLIGFIQAYIFTSLSALFISQAFEGGHHENGHGHTTEEAII
ncbi:MAG: F0F1 ATP synthase subunit A [Chitinophagaceae bacterium]